MSIRVSYASYFETESKHLGATNENLKAAERMVQLMLEERDDLINVEVISQTRNDQGFRPWRRISGERFAIRVVIEAWQDPQTQDANILVHAVVPRNNWTYDDILRLWQQHRSRIPE